MRLTRILWLALPVVLAGLAAAVALGPLRTPLIWQIEAGAPDLPDVMIAMPDGVRLATDVYLPAGRAAGPAILMRLPYGKRQYGEIRFWVNVLRPAGYAVVVQDMRGRHGSDGTFAPWPNEGADGAATLDWITAQGWSDGKVGTLGCSALGESQLMLAALNHPAHRAMVPMGAGGAAGTLEGRHTYFGAFEGGIFQLASGLGWFAMAGEKTPEHAPPEGGDLAAALQSLPVIDALRSLRPDPTDYETFLHRFGDARWWAAQGYIGPDARPAVPALYIDSWYDPSIGGTLALQRASRAAGAETQTLITPGTHCSYLGADDAGGVGDLPLDPPQERLEPVARILAFLDRHLKGVAGPAPPALHYYTLNEDRWQSASDWPPPEARPLSFYPDGTGRLSADPPPDAATRSFTADPLAPVPSLGGAICCTGDPDLRDGPLLQNPIEGRADLLLWTSDTLTAPLTIAGPITARVFVSADVPDTDLVLRLTDVDPEGHSLMIQEGALRLRYRDGFDRPAPLVPGQVVAATVDLRDIAWTVRAGHRLRLHVAGSSFPRLERNLNSGGANYAEQKARLARITLHTGPEHPTRIEIFVRPD